MDFLLLLIAIAIIALKALGKISWSWTTVALIVAALLLLPLVLGGTLATIFGFGASNTADPLLVDACGCGPNQLVGMTRRNWLGIPKDAGSAPCQTALTRVKSSKKWGITGCINP